MRERASSVRAWPDRVSAGFKKYTYQEWFAPQGGTRPAYFNELYCRSSITAVARFRLGSHCLAIETERWKCPRVPRDARTCALCACRARGDEFHIITCPALARERARYLPGWQLPPVVLGSLDNHIKSLMNGRDVHGNPIPMFWTKFADFLKAAERVQAELRPEGDPAVS